MTGRIAYAATLALLLTQEAQAMDISPGLWRLTMETSVGAAPGFVPAPYSQDQCFTTTDVRDPSTVLGGVANPGASSCTYTEKAYSGNTFRFTMRCAGTLGMQTRGEMRFTSTTLDGTITAIANVSGQKAEFSSRIRGERMGGC